MIQFLYLLAMVMTPILGQMEHRRLNTLKLLKLELIQSLLLVVPALGQILLM
jgi:hypothetical protein